MSISREEVLRIATLARIDLEDDEVESLRDELSQFEDSVEEKGPSVPSSWRGMPPGQRRRTSSSVTSATLSAESG